jgi:hypothetical protein
MSRTTLKVVLPNGDISNSIHYVNAWGFAAYIWGKMCGKYLGSDSAWLSVELSEKLWALAKDEQVPVWHRRVLRTTFDHAIIAPGAAKQIAADYRQFVRDVYTSAVPTRQCNLGAIADDLEKLPPDCRGACFHATSCGQDLWTLHTGDTERPYNIDRDSGHFFIEV